MKTEIISLVVGVLLYRFKYVLLYRIPFDLRFVFNTRRYAHSHLRHVRVIFSSGIAEKKGSTEKSITHHFSLLSALTTVAVFNVKNPSVRARKSASDRANRNERAVRTGERTG